MDIKHYEENLTKFNQVEVISQQELLELHLKLEPLIGVQFDILSIPEQALKAFEPSQIGSMIGALLDACIPILPSLPTTTGVLPNVGLKKHDGILGEREGYPDYLHESGYRLELKLLFSDNFKIEMKKPPTPREPSARLTQKVTLKNVIPERDILLVLAYSLEENKVNPGFYSPTIKDIGLFPVYNCILARDHRMFKTGGKWFGNFDTPTILSNIGKKKKKENRPLDTTAFGRKQEENKDFNEDTNFGKIARIPYAPLELFILKNTQGSLSKEDGNELTFDEE